MEQNFTRLIQPIISYFKISRYVVIALICTCLFSVSSNGQQPQDTNRTICGTTSLPGRWKKDPYVGKNEELVQTLIEHGVAIDENYLDKLGTMDAATRMNKDMFTIQSTAYYIPIKAWIYREDNGAGNISLNQLEQIITELNDIYNDDTNIHFYLLCDIEEVNDSDYANYGDTYFNTFASNNRELGAINVHFLMHSYNTSDPNPFERWAGVAKWPDDNPNYACAVIERFLPDQVNSVAHEIGHTLGLYHTHHPGRNNNHLKNEDCGDCYQESVSRTRKQGLACVSTIGARKCAVNGDFLCDTDADPALFWNGRSPESYIGANCNYLTGSGGSDNWGSTWQPGVSNIMDYAPPDCRFYFSPLQVSKMYSYIGGINIPSIQFEITGPGQLCLNQTGTYSANTLPGAPTYTWDVSGGAILSGQGTSSIMVERTSVSDVTISVRPDCGYFETSVTLQTLGNIFISGPFTVCPNTFNNDYSVEEYDNASYNWTVTNGSVISGQGSNEVTIGFIGSPPTTSKVKVSISISSPCSIVLNGTKSVGRYSQCLADEEAPQLLASDENVPIPEGNYSEGSYIEPDINIYPNAAVSTTTVVCPDDGLYDLIIIDVNGQTIFKESGVQDKYVLNVRGYENGIYFVYLVGKKTYSKKLVVYK